MSYTKITCNQLMPNLCINCQYYRKRILIDVLPKCTYEKNVDNVSGEITYNFASTFREYQCESKYYKKKEDNFFQNFIKNYFQ